MDLNPCETTSMLPSFSELTRDEPSPDGSTSNGASSPQVNPSSSFYFIHFLFRHGIFPRSFLVITIDNAAVNRPNSAIWPLLIRHWLEFVDIFLQLAIAVASYVQFMVLLVIQMDHVNFNFHPKFSTDMNYKFHRIELINGINLVFVNWQTDIFFSRKFIQTLNQNIE